MNISNAFDLQLRQSYTGSWTAEALNQIVAGILASYHREHDPVTDHHSTIAATGSISERGRTTAQGVWIPVTFGEVAFTGSGGMTWTLQLADQNQMAYTMIGMSMTIAFDLATTSVTAPLGTTLSFTIPGGFTAKRTIKNTCWIADNGVQTIGIVNVTAWPGSGTSKVDFFTPALGNWTASVNNTRMLGQLTFEVN